ncbi:MAG: insulinase family protein [Chitinophagales bacterium]|nr:insulinase family protein [Chitinophagales bacterium]
MRKIISILLIALTLTANAQVKNTKTEAKKYTHNFKTVPNDPSHTLMYTLSNGLKVYLSVNKLEPRIQTLIAVKAGSKYDPAETTGLAHYLEHMMFKGTHQFGTKDWDKEKEILDKIAAKFEEHRLEPDSAKKVALYAEIDKLSLEASKYAIANEYDKMVSSLGAKGTNAYTSNDETVYINDIPSNELEKWTKVEGERFKTLVLRLFHTELETVYEEFNRNQDNDGRWVYQGVLEGLLPNHPYGTQSTIGLGEHLKNPSMYNIHKYFDKYYVPNNVAVILSGDLDPDKTIDLIEKNFGDWKQKEVAPFKQPEKTELTTPVVKNTYGPQQEMLYMGYKFNGAGTNDAMMVKMIDMLLANSQAGLIDIDLNLKQKALNAGSFVQYLKDYTIHFLYGVPKQNQTLEEVKDLLLGEIEKIKKGDFDDWLVEAVVNDLKLQQTKSLESNRGRAFLMLDAFINDLPYNDVIFEVDELSKITKQDIIDFANKHYSNNYVVSYKRIGESDRHNVPKPKITAVEVDRDSKSKFYDDFLAMPSTSLKPKFIDFKKEITFDTLNQVPLAYVKNKNNEVFNLYYLYDIGSNTDKDLALAISYLPYLGTEKYSAEELKKEFYRYGLEFGVYAGEDQVRVYLTGLESNLEKGIELFEHVLSSVVANKEVYLEMINDIEKSRNDAKLNKGTILRGGLASYAKYGKINAFNEKETIAALKAKDVNILVNKIKSLNQYKHKVFYYGQLPFKDVEKIIVKHHKNTSNLKDVPKEKKYAELDIKENQVYFTPYDMQQVELYFIAKDELYNDKLLAPATLFNEYFGSGLSSIVFQEIREKKALAYAAYSYFSTPNEKDKSHYTYAYVGTQADKLNDATEAMLNLMNNMPEAQMQFNSAKEAAIKKLESDWVTGAGVYWQYASAQKLGRDYDIRKQVYEQIKAMTINDLVDFFNHHIKGKNYHIAVIGNKEHLDTESLNKLGKVNELTLEEIFGY